MQFESKSYFREGIGAEIHGFHVDIFTFIINC